MTVRVQCIYNSFVIFAYKLYISITSFTYWCQVSMMSTSPNCGSTWCCLTGLIKNVSKYEIHVIIINDKQPNKKMCWIRKPGDDIIFTCALIGSFYGKAVFLFYREVMISYGTTHFLSTEKHHTHYGKASNFYGKTLHLHRKPLHFLWKWLHLYGKQPIHVTWSFDWWFSTVILLILWKRHVDKWSFINNVSFQPIWLRPPLEIKIVQKVIAIHDVRAIYQHGVYTMVTK